MPQNSKQITVKVYMIFMSERQCYLDEKIK